MEKNTNILNTWRVEDVKFSTPVPPQMLPQVQAQIEMMKGNQRITYKQDGTTEEVQGTHTTKGDWEMSKNGKCIYSTNEMGQTARFIVVELTKDKFTYKLTTGRPNDTLTFYYVPFSGKDTMNKKMPAQQMPPQQEQPADNSATADSGAKAPAGK
jgi:hypothetical protein